MGKKDKRSAGRNQQKKSAPAAKSGGPAARSKTDDRAASQQAEAEATGMSREMKRMMKKGESAGRPTRPRRPAPGQKRPRTRPLAFLKEVRAELGRVAWPTRKEVITYSIVVLITVIFFMVVVGAIDYVALKAVLYMIGLEGNDG